MDKSIKLYVTVIEDGKPVVRMNRVIRNHPAVWRAVDDLREQLMATWVWDTPPEAIDDPYRDGLRIKVSIREGNSAFLATHIDYLARREDCYRAAKTLETELLRILGPNDVRDSSEDFLIDFGSAEEVAELARSIGIGGKRTVSENNTAPSNSTVVLPDVHLCAAEIWAGVDELRTVCKMFRQSVLRSQELYSDDELLAHHVRSLLEPVLDAQSVIERRLDKIYADGATINRMLIAA